MQSQVFTDEKLNDEFNRSGYVVIKLLSDEAIGFLTKFYQANPSPFKKGFHATHFSTDKLYKKKVHEAIVQTLAPNCKLILPDYMPAFGNFMIKEPGAESIMPLHADWTYIGEGEAASVAIWAPLIDTTPENGQFGVIPCSQNLSNMVRGPGIFQWRGTVDEKLISSLGKLLPVKAGEGVIYNHRLLHFSPPNNSNLVRPAVNLSLVPENMQVIHYTIPEGKTGVHRYEIDDFDFFIYYDNFQVPERGRLTGIDPNPVPIFNDRVDAFIDAALIGA